MATGKAPRRLRISQKDQQFVLSNLAVLLGAGVTVQDALSALNDEARKSTIKRVASRMQAAVDEGKSFSDAIASTAFFPSYSVALVKSGEESGHLAQNLKLVAEQLRQEMSFRSKLRGASIYPAFVMLITLLVGSSIAIFILPNLVTVFSQLDTELPLPTKILIAVGTAVRDHRQVVMIGGASVLAGLAILTILSAGFRRLFGKLAGLIPGIQKLRHYIEIARLGYVTGTLLSAGITIDVTLRAAAEAAQNSKMRRRVSSLADQIEQGKSFAEAFKFNKDLGKLFAPSVQTIIEAGEKSGQLSQSFLEVNTIYQERVDNIAKNIVVILEPFLLFIVWGFVVMLAIAVILPIYNLVGSFSL